MPPGMPVLSCSLPAFRTRGLFSMFCTEVSCSVPLRTSVPKACFLRFGRKFHAPCTCGLPYQSPVFNVLDGSFMPHVPTDFRTSAPFSAFWTDVSCPMYLLASVPGPPFLHFGRKSIFAITAFYYHISLYFFVFLKIFQNECFFCWVSCVYGSTLFSISLSYLYEYQSDT